MAIDIPGSNDSLYNSNGVAGINVATFTMALRIKKDTKPSAREVACMTASDVSAGNANGFITAEAPSVAGWYFGFGCSFSGDNGGWEYQSDLSLNQWYGAVIKYDRSATANNPRAWIDGSEVTMIETGTPTGTGDAGTDSVIYGENVGFVQDFDGKIAEAAFWDSELPDDYCAALSGSFTPRFYLKGLQLYSPFFRKEDERMQGLTYTQRGTINLVDHPGGLIYPAAPLVFPAAVAPPAGAGGNPLHMESPLIGSLA